MSNEFCVVLVSCPDDEMAKSLAEGLVSKRLAACANILSGMVSVYRWEGRLERARETLLLIKTRTDRFAALQDYVTSHHSYEVPEIIAVPVQSGLAPYLAWIGASVAEEPDA